MTEDDKTTVAASELFDGFLELSNRVQTFPFSLVLRAIEEGRIKGDPANTAFMRRGAAALERAQGTLERIAAQADAHCLKLAPRDSSEI